MGVGSRYLTRIRGSVKRPDGARESGEVRMSFSDILVYVRHILVVKRSYSDVAWIGE